MFQLIHCPIVIITDYTVFLFLTVFDKFPSNVTCSDGDIVTFSCSVHRGDILWFVNRTFVLGLPTKFNASFKTTSRNVGSDAILGENSTLQFIAKPQANNSQIQCAVGVDSKLQFDQRAGAIAFLIGKFINMP